MLTKELDKQISKINRIKFANLPTPLHECPTLSKALNIQTALYFFNYWARVDLKKWNKRVIPHTEYRKKLHTITIQYRITFFNRICKKA